MTKKQKRKQIIVGLILIILGILSITIENDATAAVLVVPLGVYAIFTKEKIFDF